MHLKIRTIFPLKTQLVSLFQHVLILNISKILSLLFISILTLPQSGWAKNWKKIRSGKKMKVFTRTLKGRDLPEFKGEGIVDSGLFEILAVL